MRVKFFTKGDKNTPSSRFRAFLVSKELQKKGIESIVFEPSISRLSEEAWPKKLYSLKKIFFKLFSVKDKDDIIFLQRTIYNKYFLIFILIYKIFGKAKIVFDFDDAIFLHSRLKTWFFVKISDGVIVGSHFLKNWVEKYNKNVLLIPTSINFFVYKEYSVLGRKANDIFTIGWLGNGPAHFENLKLLKEPFQKLVDRGLSFKFVLVGGQNDCRISDLFNDFNFENIVWISPEESLKKINSFDVGVMPLVADEWSNGKCSLKAIEYMACGVVPVISAVGENTFLVENKVNGFLVRDTKDWVEVLIELMKDSELRKNIGLNAQQRIKDSYSFESNIPKMISFLKEL